MYVRLEITPSIENYCIKLISVNNKEWSYRTCLSAFMDGKVPKLSVAKGMKWPDKPPELELHQPEERLIALRIPFMQIRELPRGGQYLKVILSMFQLIFNQLTVNSLPRPMDENFTIAVQLTKKLSFRKVSLRTMQDH